MHAAENGHELVVKLLIERGADVNAHKSTRSVLMMACQYGYTNCAKHLLDANADINAKNDRNETALMFCARYGHSGCCSLLIERNINVSGECDKPTWTSLHRACANGHTSTASILLDACPKLLDHQDEKKGFTPMMAAATSGYENTILMLLDQRARIDLKNNDWQNVVWLAARSGHTQTLKMLLSSVKNSADRKEIINEFAPPTFGHKWDKQMRISDDAPESGEEKTSEALSKKLGKYEAKDDKAEFTHKEWLSFDIPDLQPQDYIKGRDYYWRVVYPDVCEQQHMTPLMKATERGNAGAVTALLHAKASLHRVNELDKDPQIALNIAVMTGNKNLIELLLKQHSNTKDDAIEKAKSVVTEHHISDGEMTPLGKDCLTLLEKKGKNNSFSSTEKKRERIARATSFSTDTTFDKANMLVVTNTLKWDRKGAFTGQLVPPRPNEAEMAEKATPLGPVFCHRGIVLQGGPFGGIFVRVGCVPRSPWAELWQALKKVVAYYLETEREEVKKNREQMMTGEANAEYKPKAIYIAVSLRAMQAIDFGYLVERGFRFHHYRAPGHGATIAATANDKPMAPVGDQRISPSRLTKEGFDEGTAEFVYYCWPGSPESDMVPFYSTSIEGATALCFSPDAAKILLVWERGAWSMSGGAVNAGECKTDALARELYEEIGVTIDAGKGIQYLGGWSAGRARDNMSNDNFSAFAVTLASEEFRMDRKEIFEAKWFEWRPLLDMWVAQEKPNSKKLSFDMGQAKGDPSITKGDNGERNRLALNVIKGLDAYVNGRGYEVKTSEEMQGPMRAVKAKWGSLA